MSMDEQYFVRGNRDLRMPLESFHFLIDDQFSTCQDGTVATIMAYDMLIVYLRKEVDDLNNNMEPTKNTPMEKPSKLFWTGSKTDLIELLYALHTSKSINGGTVDIKRAVPQGDDGVDRMLLRRTLDVVSGVHLDVDAGESAHKQSLGVPQQVGTGPDTAPVVQLSTKVGG